MPEKLTFANVVQSIEYDGNTVDDYQRRLREQVQALHGEVAKASLSTDAHHFESQGTEFVTINGLADAFDAYRDEQGDETFECQDSDKIESAAKSQVIEAKIAVLTTLGHIPKGQLKGQFAATLKRELSYAEIRALDPNLLSYLWVAFADWKELNQTHKDAQVGSFKISEDDSAELVEMDEEIKGMECALERLTGHREKFLRESQARASDDKDENIAGMLAKADRAKDLFDRRLDNSKAD